MNDYTCWQADLDINGIKVVASIHHCQLNPVMPLKIASAEQHCFLRSSAVPEGHPEERPFNREVTSNSDLLWLVCHHAWTVSTPPFPRTNHTCDVSFNISVIKTPAMQRTRPSFPSSTWSNVASLAPIQLIYFHGLNFCFHLNRLPLSLLCAEPWLVPASAAMQWVITLPPKGAGCHYIQ